MNLTTTATNQLLGLNRKTINKYFDECRELIQKDGIQEPQKEITEFKQVGVIQELNWYNEKEKDVQQEKLSFYLKHKAKIFISIAPKYSKEALLSII